MMPKIIAHGEQGRRAVSRIEALVCGSVLAIAIGAIAGPLSTFNQESAMSEHCKRNLGRLAQLAAISAMQDRLSILHPQSSNGEYTWRGLGSWDWGGAEGACGEANSAWPTSPYNLGAPTRPFNKLLFGATIPPNADFSLFHCPSDTGTDFDSLYRAYYADPSPCSSSETEAALKDSMFRAMGNSYQGDFFWAIGESFPNNQTALRFGSFLRPAEMYPAPSETLLFYDHPFAMAITSTAEAVQQNLVFGTPVSVRSWHQADGLFNLANADGHVQSVPVNVSGSLLDPATMPSSWIARLRGQTWRYDAYPEVTVREGTTGSAILFAPGGTGDPTIRSSAEYVGAPPQ